MVEVNGSHVEDAWVERLVLRIVPADHSVRDRVVWVGSIGQNVDEGGIGFGTPAVVRWAGAFSVDASGQSIAFFLHQSSLKGEQVTPAVFVVVVVKANLSRTVEVIDDKGVGVVLYVWCEAVVVMLFPAHDVMDGVMKVSEGF